MTKQNETALQGLALLQPLDPELEQYLTQGDGGDKLPMLRHPLVYAVPYVTGLNGLYNKILESKRRRMTIAVSEGRLHTYVHMHERPYRAWALGELLRCGLLPESTDTSRLIADTWADTENAHEERELWHKLLLRAKPHAHAAMSDEDKAVYAALEDKVRVFRGIDAAHDERDEPKGFSWTTDRSRARWFAFRFAAKANAKVWMGSVAKKDILFVSGDRNEHEIVVLPEHVGQLSIRKVNL